MSNQGNRLQQAPFIRILIYFSSGIALAEWFLPPKSPLWFIVPAFLLLCLIFRNKRSKQDFSGLLILLIFLSLGFSWAVLRRYDPKPLPKGEYVGVLDEYPLEKGNLYRATVKLTGSGTKILAYFIKSPELINAKPGMFLFFKGEPQLINNGGNPYEFNYRNYSIRNHVGHRIYIDKNNYHFLSTERKWNLSYEALILREIILKRLEETGLKGETFRVISAITLGARDNLDPETTRSFTRTGTLHVLAVSGGNVAVVYAFLYLFFGFLKKRKTALIFTVLILIGIWMYTFITGLSPSVLRAAVMFSFIVIGKSIRRNPDIYNILSSSAFILLFLKPTLLYDVGFQLSYAAVFAIVFLQPIFFKLFFSKYWIVDKLWIFFTISLAAQIGTLPFSLWYFHQFPVYFWLSNIIVVPLVSLFLYLTFFVILIAPLIPTVAFFTSQILALTGNIMLKFLHFVEYLPLAMIENIYPSASQLIFTLLVITLIILYLLYRKSHYLFAALFSLTILLILNTIDLWKILSRNEIVIFNTSDRILVAFTHKSTTTWLTDMSTKDSSKLNYLIKPYEGFRRIRKSERFYLELPSSKNNGMISIRHPFFNFRGLTICFQNTPSQVPEGDFPSVDLIFLNKSGNMKYEDYFRKTSLASMRIRKTPPIVLIYKKASPPERISFGEESALLINIDQKTADKRNVRIRTW